MTFVVSSRRNSVDRASRLPEFDLERRAIPRGDPTGEASLVTQFKSVDALMRAVDRRGRDLGRGPDRVDHSALGMRPCLDHVRPESVVGIPAVQA